PARRCDALRQAKGANCPLFLPVVSSHERPSAWTWLFVACASANRSAAGWPVLSRCSGSVLAGLIPIAACAAMSTLPFAFTDQLAPVRSKRIAADSEPRNLPTSPDTAAIGPPAAPLAIETIASRFPAHARSSAPTPTDHLP